MDIKPNCQAISDSSGPSSVAQTASRWSNSREPFVLDGERFGA